MVVSSETPLMLSARPANQPFGFSASFFFSSAKKISSSSLSGLSRKAVSPFLGAQAEMDEHGGVATVVEDHVRHAAVMPVEQARGVVPVLLQGLALHGEDRMPAAAMAAAAWSWVE